MVGLNALSGFVNIIHHKIGPKNINMLPDEPNQKQIYLLGNWAKKLGLLFI
jgi:hypothetical protein